MRPKPLVNLVMLPFIEKVEVQLTNCGGKRVCVSNCYGVGILSMNAKSITWDRILFRQEQFKQPGVVTTRHGLRTTPSDDHFHCFGVGTKGANHDTIFG
jgi:hypothetical protein